MVAVTTALGCASTRTHEGTGEYVDDSVITTKVKAAIFNERGLTVSEIEVETSEGIVQSSGFVLARGYQRRGKGSERCQRREVGHE